MTVRRGGMKAIRLASGKYSYGQLAKMGHPYGIKNTGRVPYNDLARINLHTGTFASSFQKLPQEVKGDKIIGGLINTAPYASSLAFGIRNLTKPRPYMKEIEKTMELWRMKNIAKGIRDALKH